MIMVMVLPQNHVDSRSQESVKSFCWCKQFIPPSNPILEWCTQRVDHWNDILLIIMPQSRVISIVYSRVRIQFDHTIRMYYISSLRFRSPRFDGRSEKFLKMMIMRLMSRRRIILCLLFRKKTRSCDLLPANILKILSSCWRRSSASLKFCWCS